MRDLKMPQAYGTMKLKRAGALVKPKDSERVIQSKFIRRYEGRGRTEAEAMKSYELAQQEPDNWRGVADEYLGGLPVYQNNLEDCTAEEVETPTRLWINVVLDVFRTAYKSHQLNTEAIARVYAFAEWCLIQKQPDADASSSLATAASISFYECIPRIPEALQDMPNWFDFSEVETMFLANPFSRIDAAEIKTVYLRT